MKKSYILIILISFLVISPKLYAQVVCPCDYDVVPKTLECWNQAQGDDRFWSVQVGDEGEQNCDLVLGLFPGRGGGTIFVSMNLHTMGINQCEVKITDSQEACGLPLEIDFNNITPEEVKACECDLLAYVTELNNVDGITVSGGPPYECSTPPVECAPPPTQPPVANVPTLSGWGLLSLAVVLGILGIAGFMVMRRRKVTA